MPDPRAVEVRWPLNIVKAERSIFELHRQWQSGFLKLSPDYQREFVWKPSQQMKLVESVMARIPLPVFYLSEESEEEMLVVDGQQRLTTLFAFMEGWFPDPQHKTVIRSKTEPGGRLFLLKDLRLMPELNEDTFASFGARRQRYFENTPLTCFIIQKGTADSVKYELFGRLNQGASPLNPQEMRNALDRGEGLHMVRALAADGGLFREVAGRHRSYERRRADELVLRGLSFLWRSHEKSSYKGDLQSFLNESLKMLNRAAESEREHLRSSFLHALEVARTVFVDHAFQRFDPEKDQWAGHVSGPLVEAQTAVLGRFFRDRLPNQEQADRILRRFQELCRDPVFQDAILKATQTSRSFQYRMEHFEEIVADVDQP